MPARKAVTWAELRVGILVLLTLAIVAAFIFYVTGEGVLFARHLNFRTYLPDVAGLKAGAPVRLAGVEVGTVLQVGLSQFREEPARATEVRFRVREDFQADIREDSEAFITTEGLLGESVLEITRGSTGEIVPGGGEVPGTRRGNIKQIVQNVDQITGDVRALIADVRAGKGTIGKLIVDPALYDRAAQAVDEFQSLTQRAAAGEGSLGKLMVSEELYDQLKATADTLEEAANNVRAGKGTLGALIYDTKFYDDAVGVVERADRVVARVEAGEGTLGKLIADDALYNDTQETFANAREITRKFNEGEGTFGRAVNDPRLYENINEFTTEMRALISDFRKNPKEYLRIKFSLF
jgi:phospholipid/cholesterol/gamma-HCH transport system substrate-binding protein